MELYLVCRILRTLFQTIALVPCFPLYLHSFGLFSKLYNLGIGLVRFRNLFLDKISARTLSKQILYRNLYKLMFYLGNPCCVGIKIKA
jgi:hypothetical protein